MIVPSDFAGMREVPVCTVPAGTSQERDELMFVLLYQQILRQIRLINIII
jgi:hypothetical protein